MLKLTPYTLNFRDGLHLGMRGTGLEDSVAWVPSDTLFAAILDAWRRSGEDPQTFVQPFIAQDAPFLLTSAFPQVGTVRFFPVPLNNTALFSWQVLHDRRKKLKGLCYMSEALLRKASQGGLLDGLLFPDDEEAEPQGDQGVALQGGALWLTQGEVAQLPPPMRLERKRLHNLRYAHVWSLGRVPRVTVERRSSASTIFHAGRAVFAGGCGLWFGMQWRHPDKVAGSKGQTYSQAVSHALAMLQHDGLGGERTAGYGAFEFSEGDSFTLEEAEPEGLALLLSRYHPRDDELPVALTAPDAAYEMTPVEGWLRSPDEPAQRRRLVYLLAEGGFVRVSRAPAGDVVDVRPVYMREDGSTDQGVNPFPHPVYRYGLALCTHWAAQPPRIGG